MRKKNHQWIHGPGFMPFQIPWLYHIGHTTNNLQQWTFGTCPHHDQQHHHHQQEQQLY